MGSGKKCNKVEKVSKSKSSKTVCKSMMTLITIYDEDEGCNDLRSK